MKHTLETRLASVLLPLIIAAGSAQAASTSYSMIVSTSEGVGAFNSTLSGTKVQDFNNYLGVNSSINWNDVGTFSQVNVIAADQYGGAPGPGAPTGTPYAVEGIGVIGETTLTLNKPSSYFGLYWSAGDGANSMTFYNQGQVVANFTTANLMSMLPQSYYGNPIDSGWQSGANKSEPYGFINFIGDANTSWDTIVFGNTHGSGFEADNYTVRTNGWNPLSDGGLPGTPMLYLENTDGTQTVSKINSTDIDGDVVTLGVNKSGGNTFVNFAPSAPAAPAPPLPIIAAFAAVIGLKGLRRKKDA